MYVKYSVYASFFAYKGVNRRQLSRVLTGRWRRFIPSILNGGVTLISILDHLCH